MSSGSGAPVNLGEFLRKQLKVEPGHEGLLSVIESIADASKELSRSVRAAGLANILGATGKVNVQGEASQVLDELATEGFAEALRKNEHVAGFACEELESSEIFPERTGDRYLSVFDPIDGSSNIDVAAPIGSIFGIHPVGSEEVTEASFLRPGREQIAAVYAIYGSSTQFVVATKERVDIFTLDPASGEYLLTLPNARIPETGPYYSANEGNADAWSPGVQAAIAKFRKTLSLRYIGTLVSDFHRGLLKGGIFLYPADKKNRHGKLRLLYEANPLAFVAEAAGGAASAGHQRILDIVPTAIHERVPLFIGNTDLVQEVEAAESQSGAGAGAK
jgi:fructose-1,6-bisphosphatase I